MYVSLIAPGQFVDGSETTPGQFDGAETTPGQFVDGSEATPGRGFLKLLMGGSPTRALLVVALGL